MQVYKFLDKNYDQVRQDVLDLFIQSKNNVRGQDTCTFIFTLINVNNKKCIIAICVCIQMVSNLFLVHAEIMGKQRGGHMRKSSTVTRKYQAPTVSSKFQQSLLELVEKMER